MATSLRYGLVRPRELLGVFVLDAAHPALVEILRSHEYHEETGGENHARNGCDDLGREVHECRQQQDEEDER
jgi:hypothetical protein